MAELERKSNRIASRIWALAKEMTHRFFRHGVGNSAAALTYYMIFAFFPLLIFLTSIIGGLNLPPLSAKELQTFIPMDILELINTFLAHVNETTTAPLMIFGLVFSVYFPVRAVASLMDFIALAYDRHERRSIVSQSIIILIFAVGLAVAVIGSLLLLVAGRWIITLLSAILPEAAVSIRLWSWLRFLLVGGAILLLLTLLYLVAPGGVVTLKEALPGACGSLLCWLCYTVGFSFYVEQLGRYSVVYGSIGAIIVLLIWLYASSVTIIMGAELNAALKLMGSKG